MMNPEVKQKWLEALRSGEYRQGVGTLKRILPDGQAVYCCLGVLCDLYAKEHPEAGWAQDSTFRVAFIPNRNEGWEEQRSWAVPPAEVAQWAGFWHWESANPAIRHARYSTLAELNDYGSNGASTFEHVIPAIEEL